MSGTIKFLKVRDVKSPSRANRYDAGIDFYVPEFTEEFLDALIEKNKPNGLTLKHIESGWEVVIPPQKRILIPSGIHCQMFDNNRALIAANKSGVATKHGLIFGAQVVDYEYQGEIHISLINTSDEPVVISSGMKAIQFLEMPIFTSEIRIDETLSPDEFYEVTTTRGADGFGSTDKT